MRLAKTFLDQYNRKSLICKEKEIKLPNSNKSCLFNSSSSCKCCLSKSRISTCLCSDFILFIVTHFTSGDWNFKSVFKIFLNILLFITNYRFQCKLLTTKVVVNEELGEETKLEGSSLSTSSLSSASNGGKS